MLLDPGGSLRRHQLRGPRGQPFRVDMWRLRARVREQLVLAGTDARALLQMTPYWWHATAEQQAAVAARPTLETTVDVVVTTHPVRR